MAKNLNIQDRSPKPIAECLDFAISVSEAMEDNLKKDIIRVDLCPKNINFNLLTLENLEEADVNALNADTLHPAEQESLSRTPPIYSKTARNKFFTHQPLRPLYFHSTVFLVLLLLFGCNPNNSQQEGGSLSSSEKEKSYEPLVNSLGDSLLTGVEIPVVGKKLSVDEIMDVRLVPVGKPIVTPAHTNIYKVTDYLKTVLPIDLDTLPRFTIGDITDPLPLVNSIGDTIPTGVPLPIKGEKVAIQWPEPVPALSPRYKDKATMDIKFLGVEQGLSSNWMESMIQDSSGYFWFGTYGGGLTRYDGVSFLNFTEAHGLTNNIVYEIYEDSKGRIWLGTDGGLMYFDGKDFVQFNEADGFANNRVMGIMEDRKGNLWFGSYGYGLCKYDGESFTYYFENEGCQSVYDTSILEDRNGDIWFSTWLNGVFKFDGSAFTQVFSMDTSGALHEDGRGNIWIGALDKLYMYDGKQLNECSYEDASIIMGFCEDAQGNIWIGSRLNGLTKFDGRNFTNITEEQGLSGKVVSTILEDDSGKIWMATYGGINIYDPNSFKHPKMFDNTLVRSIYQDSKGNVWFGTDGNGVIKYDGQNYSQFTEDQGFFKSTSAIWGIEEDYMGNIWFGALSGGLIKYDGQVESKALGKNKQATFTHYFANNEANIEYNNVISLIEDKHQQLWIGYDGAGLLRFDGKTFVQFTIHEGLIGDKLNPNITEDQRGNLWVSSATGGITKVDLGLKASEPLKFTHFSEKEGLTGNMLGRVLTDQQGTVFIPNNYGSIFSYKKKTGTSDSKVFTRINLDGVRSNKSIHSMVRDPKGGIWLSGQMGLDRLTLNSIDSLELNFSNSSYSLQDGLKGLSFFSSVILDNNNHIWWSTNKGITQLDINQYQEYDQQIPEVHLNQIKLNGSHIDYRNIIDSLAKDVKFDSVGQFSNVPTNLQLQYNINNISFHFSALDWSAPHDLRYSYLLEGFNEDWSIPDKAAQANYPKLPHGLYSLKVRAVGKNMQWSDTLSYTFTILPQWWLTWWAKSFYILLFLLVMIAIVLLRTRNLKIRSEELEERVNERTMELKESQSQLVQAAKMASLGQLTAGIAHEINNPVSFTQTSSFALDQDMNDITNLIEKYRSYIQEGKQDKSKIEEFEKSIDYQTLLSAINQEIADIKEGTKRTSEIVKNLREFSHEDSGEMKLANIHDGMETTLNILKGRFTAQISLTKDYDQSIGEIKCNIGQLNQVFMNILSNGLDAIEEKGEIIITTKNQGNSLLISIKNDGPGISEALIDKIFDPFFTTKKIGEGVGLGLSLSHGIIKNHGGTISVESILGKETRFEISLPIR